MALLDLNNFEVNLINLKRRPLAALPHVLYGSACCSHSVAFTYLQITAVPLFQEPVALVQVAVRVGQRIWPVPECSSLWNANYPQLWSILYSPVWMMMDEALPNRRCFDPMEINHCLVYLSCVVKCDDGSPRIWILSVASQPFIFFQVSASLKFFISKHQYVLPAASDSCFNAFLYLWCENIRFRHSQRTSSVQISNQGTPRSASPVRCCFL